jgi:hypothetical protein
MNEIMTASASFEFLLARALPQCGTAHCPFLQTLSLSHAHAHTTHTNTEDKHHALPVAHKSAPSSFQKPSHPPPTTPFLLLPCRGPHRPPHPKHLTAPRRTCMDTTILFLCNTRVLVPAAATKVRRSVICSTSTSPLPIESSSILPPCHIAPASCMSRQRSFKNIHI